MIRVGILTFHNAHNYGAYLQSFALCNALNKDNEINAEVIDFIMQVEKKRYSLNTSLRHKIGHPLSFRFEKKVFTQFELLHQTNQLKKSKDSLVSDSIEDFNKFVYGKYDIIVVGSDEVWKLESFRGFPNPYWLIGDCGAIKCSYAASSRSNFDVLDSSDKKILKDALEAFSYISVRDELTYSEIKSLGIDSDQLKLIPDPTLIFDFKPLICKDILKKRIHSKKKTILVMTEDDEIAKKLVGIYAPEYNIVSVYSYHSGCLNVPDLSPIEWMSAIAEADFVVTSYFHAVCMCLNFRKKFLAIGTKNKASKVLSLLRTFDLADRYAENIGAASRENFKSMLNTLMEKELKDYQMVVKKNHMAFEEFVGVLKAYEN